MKKILLVEDSPFDVELILHAAACCHIADHFVVVSDGMSALDYLFARAEFANRVRNNPALMLLDLNMPGMDGIEVLKKVRTSPALSDIPVVIMSMSDSEADLRRAAMLGIQDFIPKSLDIAAFSTNVCRLVRYYLSNVI